MGVMQAAAPGRVPARGMKTEEAGKLRRLAARMETDHPETMVHGHLRDAARALDRGDTKAASRHLAVARHTLTPVQLYRHGIVSGDRHAAARTDAGELDRRMLALRDIHDVEQRHAAGLEARTATVTAQQAHAAAEAAKKGQLGMVKSGVPFGIATRMQALQPVAKPAGPVPPSPVGLANGPRPYVRQPDETVQCPICHRWDAPDARFCDQCGNSLLASKPGYRPKPYDAQGEGKGEPVTCPNCGQGDAADARFCDQCGHQLDTSAYRDLAAWHHAQAAIELGLFRHDEPRDAAGKWTDKNGVSIDQHLAALKGFRDRIKAGDSQAITDMENYTAALDPKAAQRIARMTDAANSGPALEMSARTGMLARTPAPRGKPGGPGLYDVQGMGHTPYLQQIVKALIEKRGMPEGKAYAIARAAIRKWSRGGGHVHPEVQAAAGAAESGELARQARAKASHGHASDAANIRMIWQLANVIADHPAVIELFNPAGNPAQPRVPVGQTGAGQFTAGGGGQQAQGKQQKGKGKPPAKKPVTAQQRAQAKAALEQKIKGEKLKLSGLRKTLAGLLAQQAHSAAARAQATKAGQTGKSKAATPAKKQQATKTPTTAQAAAAASAAVHAAAAKAGVKPGGKKPSLAQQIASTRAAITALSKTIATQSAQAAKL